MSKEPPDREGDEGHHEQLRFSVFETKPEGADKTTTANPRESKKENRESMLTTIYNTFFRNRAAAWTAGFTFVLAIFSYLLWQANDQANKTSIATQRAFISFSGPGLEPLVDNNVVVGYRVHMPMNNGGTTGTKNSEFEESSAIQDSVPEEGTNFDGLPQAERFHYVFGPKQAYDPQGAVMTLSDTESLDRGKHVFVWGWIVYRDTFDGTDVHLSEYCLLFSNPRWAKLPHTDPTSGISMTNLPCQTHYCYDHQCADYTKRTEGFK
jgi:hypothetical protein